MRFLGIGPIRSYRSECLPSKGRGRDFLSRSDAIRQSLPVYSAPFPLGLVSAEPMSSEPGRRWRITISFYVLLCNQHGRSRRLVTDTGLAGAFQCSFSSLFLAEE